MNLEFTPTEEMTWGVWETALLGIGGFFQKWEYVALSFDVVAPEVGRLGTGRVFREQEERVGLGG